MVQSRLTYCILAWGFNYQRLVKIQKRFMRIIANSKYNAHTEPPFKSLELLNIQRLFDLNCLKFVYRFKQRSLPSFFLSFDCIPRSDIHEHDDIRYANLRNVEGTRTKMAENCFRHHLITILNTTPDCILSGQWTRSEAQGFAGYLLQRLIVINMYDQLGIPIHPVY